MKGLNRIFIVFVAVLFISGLGFSEIIVSSGSSDSHNSAVAVNQDGVVLVVWCSGGGPEDGTLWYNVQKEGVWQGSRNVKRTRSGSTAWSPQLDVDSNGLFHLAWADGHSRYDREIFYSTYDPDTGWSPREMIWDSPMNSAWERMVVVDDIVSIIWFHQHLQINDWVSDIVMISKPVGGFWPSAYERISYRPHDESIHPAFDINNGRVHTVYMEGVGTEGGSWRLRYKEGSLGSYWESLDPETLSKPVWYPDMEVDKNSDSHVIWATRAGTLLYRQQLNDVWQGVQSINNMYCPLQHPDVHYANDILCAVWRQQDDAGSRVFYSIKTPPGQFSKPVQVATAGHAEYPQVWIDNFGYAHFVFDERSGSRRIIYEKIQIYDPPALLKVSKKNLNYTLEGVNPADQNFVIKNEGSENLTYSITKTKAWLSLSRMEGTLGSNQEHQVVVSISAADKDEGIYRDTITITSPESVIETRQVDVKLTVIAPPIYEVVNFSSEIQVNKALFYREYIHKLTWQANPQNRDIVNYRLYKNDGVNRILMNTFPATTFEYFIRGIRNPTETHSYELVAVDKRDREGPPSNLDVSGTK